MVLVVFLLLFCPLIDARQVKHYLQYRFTALTKADTFPEFSAEAVADDRLVCKYNNKTHVWERESLTKDDWTKSPAEPPDSRDWFIHQMKRLSNCKDSQCSKSRVLQRIIGCELEKFANGSEKSRSVFDKYGFDGEDLLAFNSDIMKWTEKNPKAKETKLKWDLQIERNQFIKYYLETCMSWISTFNNTRKSSPDVYIFGRKSDKRNLNLTCLVTGFYPRDIKIKIRSDKGALKNQTSSGIRPNADGSFQMRISVKINSSHKGSYDCHVTHSSLSEPLSVQWDGTCFDRETPPWAIIAGVIAVIAVLIILFLIIYKQSVSYGQVNRSNDGFSMMGNVRRSNSTENQVEIADSDSDSSSGRRVTRTLSCRRNRRRNVHTQSFT